MASQMTNRSPGNWALGGRPEKHVDIPITAVFLVLFMIGAASHMTIFQLNRRRGHKFIFSVVLFGFCMARIVSCILRIASTSLPTNANLAIAAAVFVGAATLILFIINLLWSQRILRSLHPGFGWHPITSAGFKILYVLTGLTLVISITATVQSLLTVNPKIRATDRSLQLYGQTFLAVMSSLPILVVFIALIMPRRGSPDKFGSGRMSTKIIVLLAGSALVTLGAWYRCGTSWQTPVPRSRPLPGYFSKPAFYIFNFGVEVLTIYLYAIMRVDLRFHVPNGAKGPGSYEIQAQNRVGDSADTTEVDKEMQG